MKKVSIIILVIGVIILLFLLYMRFGFVTVGYKPKYINPTLCSENSRFVIKQENLSPIHSCKDEELGYGFEKANLVKIASGEGSDCIAGCIYSTMNYIVFENNSIYKIKDRYFADHDYQLKEYIWSKTKLPINNIENVAIKELIIVNDSFAINYVFIKYLKGEVRITELNERKNWNRITGEITPTDMTIEQAKEIAINEILKEGKTITKEPITEGLFPNKDCWNFGILTDYGNEKLKKCSVMVCLNKSTKVEC